MALYAVHSRPGGALEDAVFVREGFSPAAFAFSLAWALWHRMWLVAAAMLAGFAALEAGGRALGIGEAVLSLAVLAANLVFGFEAQRLRQLTLEKSGRPQIATSHGRNLEEAELRYFLAALPKPAGPPGPRFAATGSGVDTLGIFGNV